MFFAATPHRAIRFLAADGNRLTDRSIPEGCWPLCYVEKAQDKFLYFQYFLSSTLHKWSLTTDFGRREGLAVGGLEAREIIEQLPENKCWAWVRAKFLNSVLSVEEFDSLPESEFSKIEIAFANALINRNFRSFLLGNLARDGAVRNTVLDEVVFGGRVARMCLCPLGYRDPIRLSVDQFSQIDDVWEYLESNLSGINFAAVAEIWTLLYEKLNEYSAYSQSKFIFGGTEIFPDDLCCKIIYDHKKLSDYSDGQTCIVFRIILSERLISGDITRDSRAAIVGRLRHSLLSLRNHLLRLAEIRNSGFSLSFSFSDHGRDGYISFDRPAGSECTLIPDLYLLSDSRSPHVYSNLTREQFARSFEEKRPNLFWRGATTGGYISSYEDISNNFRIKSCVNIKDRLSDVADCKISNIVQSSLDQSIVVKYLESHGIFGDSVQEEEFGKYMLYLDLPGNCAAWGTYQKYLLGCAVIRPVPSARELLYYDKLEKGKHYIAVRSDLADIEEVVRRALSDRSGTASIAFSGRRKMIELIRDLPNEVVQALSSTPD